MNDKELLTLLKSDPGRGLEQAVRQYGAYVKKIIYTRLADTASREDMEEAVSDVFLKFYSFGKRCGFELDSVRAVLAVISKRHSIDLFKKLTGHTETVNIDELDCDIPYNDKSYDPELIDAVRQLGPPDSYIIIRKYYFGQKNTEIAKELKMKNSTLNMRLSRALKKLKKILEEDNFNG